jgi:hypothetical protein
VISMLPFAVFLDHGKTTRLVSSCHDISIEQLHRKNYPHRVVLVSVMARFASACMECHVQVTRKLEATLGPDTADMGIRFGKVQLLASADDVICLPHLTRISRVR